MKLQDIPSALSAIADEGRFRRVEDLRMVTASRGIRRDGKEYIVFNSNDYLGMTHESEVMAAARRAVIYGTGSGGARLTSGAVFELSELEKALAAFKHAEDAVIFNTGYMTNLGVLYALAGKGDVIFSDALNHASIVDGCRISKARVVVYAHSDMEDLARLLAETPCEGQRFIVTDGVFSMDGDICPLPSLLSLKKKYEACLIVDDAHSVASSATPDAARQSTITRAASTSKWGRSPSRSAPRAATRRLRRRSRTISEMFPVPSSSPPRSLP